MDMSRKKIIILIVCACVVLLIGGIIYVLIPRATLVLSVAPDELTLVVNGKSQTVKTGQEVTIAPGEITVELQRPEFDTYTEKFSIKNGEKREILVALNPQTDAARDLLRTDTSQQIIQRVGGKKVKEGGAQILTQYPILKDLPISDKFYTVKACTSRQYPNDPSKIAICINLFDMAAKQSAVSDIERRGYQLSNYEVVYIDATYSTQKAEHGE